MKFQRLIVLFSFFSLTTFAQSDVDSPYSLFGIGKENTSYFGGSAGLANTGIAYSNKLLLNKINPASLTSLSPTAFLYEIGINNTLSIKVDNDNSQTNYDFNFTHIALGFSVSDRWKMSFGLVPQTKTSYNIDITEPVEGNTNLYYTNIEGSGGINELFWGHGFKATKNLSLGLEMRVYFGSINQERTIDYLTTQIYLDETKKYTGLGIKGGFQYKFNNLFGTNTTIGGIINVPSSLSGSQDIEGTKTFTSIGTTTIIDETDNDLDDFELPLKIGFGISTQVRKLTFNLDFHKKYWSNSYTSDSNFTYRDQSVYGLGIEYKRETNSLKYYRKIIYRMGINYDSGYLNYSDSKIDSYGISAGIGFPMSNKGSTLNLSYSYGKEGTLNNNLVIDNFHKMSINVSLFDNWFTKRKIY
ncbi:OmpP1/FadL family transporter [Lutibacter holmesii]|uniref:OmpP1/FadL family transporter n=1 Tax=Lutibacter holmesii TaxID=1137985 RepID=A0ABW3WJ41_9FLAO